MSNHQLFYLFGERGFVLSSKMKILQFYQNFLTYLIVRDKSPEAIPPPRFQSGIFGYIEKNFVTLQNLFVYSIMVNGAFLLFVYLFEVAGTFQEYSETAYAISTLICCATVIRIFEVNKKEIFQLIDNIEHTVEMRNYYISSPRHNFIIIFGFNSRFAESQIESHFWRNQCICWKMD